MILSTSPFSDLVDQRLDGTGWTAALLANFLYNGPPGERPPGMPPYDWRDVYNSTTRALKLLSNFLGVSSWRARAGVGGASLWRSSWGSLAVTSCVCAIKLAAGDCHFLRRRNPSRVRRGCVPAEWRFASGTDPSLLQMKARRPLCPPPTFLPGQSEPDCRQPAIDPDTLGSKALSLLDNV